MSKIVWWIIGIVVLIAAVAALQAYVLTPVADVPTPATSDQSVSDGVLTIPYASSDFSLATNETQVGVSAYIPPCTSPFEYCLYYTGGAYQGTNFEAAGLAVRKRTTLRTERLCLDTPPSGYDASAMPAAHASEDSYASSVFSDIGDAGAGHYAAGSLYRLFVRADSSCYEFETRIGETQFANYPEGSIREFTDTDRTMLEAAFSDMLEHTSLGGAENLFPRTH